MKTNKKKMCSLRRGIYIFALLSMIVCLYNCNDDYKEDIVERPIVPPSFSNLEFSKYYPDSGPKATKLMLYGKGFGTDTSYIKVTVNDVRAVLMGVNDTIIYAVVPRRADTGFVKVFVGKEDTEEPKAFSSEDFEDPEKREFKYIFRRNVTTPIGKITLPKANEAWNSDSNKPTGSRVNGSYEEARFQRPRDVMFDKDGVMYIMEEGQGTNQNGAIRRAYNGQVTTLTGNTEGWFRNPTRFCFNIAQDTMFMTQDTYNTDVRSAVTYFTRESNFTRIGSLVTYEQARDSLKAANAKNKTFDHVMGIAINPVTDAMFVATTGDCRLFRIDRALSEDGKTLSANVVDVEMRIDGTTGESRALVFSEDGRKLYALIRNDVNSLYVCDYDISTGAVSSPEGALAGSMLRFVGIGRWDHTPSGIGTGIGFDHAFDLEIDGRTLYVCEREAHRIKQVDLETLYVSVLAGPREANKIPGYKDGVLEDAKFYFPEGIGLDNLKNVYVADRENHVLRMVVNE